MQALAYLPGRLPYEYAPATMRAMMDINEIRHFNVRLLVRRLEEAEGRTGDRAGGLTMLAAKLGKSSGQVAHFASERPIKNIGDQIARQIEQAMGLERGWMDWLQDGAEPAPESVSRSVRLDPKIVRSVGVALNLRHKSAGGYNLAELPDEFVRAYELWIGMPDAYEAPEVFNLVIQHADLSPQGASEDERGSKGAPPNGAPREGVRAGRGGKA
jgi:hypothetical protein